MQKIGVFVCHCGTNISATVDVKKVAETLGKEPGVVYSTDYQFMCSSSGQNLVIDKIKELGLTGVVICSCSPRMHEKTFRKAADKAGLNSFLLEMANIREQDAWVHKNREEATLKAVALARAAVAKVHLNTPLTPGSSDVNKRALVIGGGIAGMQAALDIADAGFKVDIVEREATIGGTMTQIDKTFPTLDCASCILTPKMVDCEQHENISLVTKSEVDTIEGYVGNFTVKIKHKAKYVDPDKCTGCGLCIQKCPSKKVPDPFNLNLAPHTAINITFPQAVPLVATIDADNCLMIQKGKCGLCATVCPADAINYEDKDSIEEKKYGAIIVSTGFKPISLHNFDEYAYDNSPNVVTSLEYERLMSATGPGKGTVLRPSDGKHPKTIVFQQCVGSRDTSGRGKTYCSGICCMYTAKHAMLTREKYPDTDVYVFYTDVRSPGKGFDEFYRRAVEKYHVHYIKGAIGKVVPMSNGNLQIQASDLLMNEQLHIEADLLVLAAAMEPDKSAKPLAQKLTASMDNDDWFTESHPKLRPVESPTAGVFLAGACQGPKDIPQTVAQAGAAASKAIGLLIKDKLQGNPCVAHSDENMCNGCSQCANVCPYGAITYEEKDFRMPDRTTLVRRVASVNPAVCQGCGACTVVCPSGAMDLFGFSNKQILAEVDALCL
ncbi:MAG: CoB--CoM heterodisulfide reductase iron-sulfur subunit A family protein [Sphaerochaetaceae bacterium]|nr:CoB--CoM heterodisulfide reductase iron-sulfur subunit A family protein [Sphaerochaetaceae bacterium]